MDDVRAVYRAVLYNSAYDSAMDVNNDSVLDMCDVQLILKIYLDTAA